MSEKIEKLKILEASLIVLTQKIYNFHWNMKGCTFMSSHKQTEKLFETLTQFYDDVAEKIVMHNEVAIGTLKEALDLSKIEEVPSKKINVCEVNKLVVEDLTTIINLTDEVEGTNVIQPLKDEIYLALDKARWMFKAQTEKICCDKKVCKKTKN